MYMAYANQNRGVFIPYHQLIDLRSLNPPVTFVPRPHIGLINPRNGSGLQLLVPVGFSLNQEYLIRMEEARSRSLLQFMAGEGLVPSPEEEMKRKNAIEKLKEIVMEWIRMVAFKRGLTNVSAAVLTYGSYGLGVHNSESDIDALCVVPHFATMREDFFIALYNMLTRRPEVSEVHCITDAKVPLMRFKLDGISIDLPYAQLQTLHKNVDILDPNFLRTIDETSWRSLSGVHVNNCILQLIPKIEVFQSLLRCVKLWAKRRGIYGNLLGFFGGVHLAILAAFICQRYPNARLSVLISRFFKLLAFWHWPTPIILQDDEMLPISGIAAETRSLMPIKLPCRPHEYCHSNITESTFYRIRAEFLRGHALTKDLLRPDFDWACLFEPFPYTETYTRFVKICLLASDEDELGQWVGWVKSRFRSLLVKLEEIQGFCDPNPTEFVDVDIAIPNTVFYWGLQPERRIFLDIQSIKEDFIKNLSNGYQGYWGKITLAVVQASQLHNKNAQFDSEGSKE